MGGYLVRALLRITGEAPDAAARPPLDLALVLDRSGSMNGDKLARAKEAASLLVRRLGEEDVVSIVVYGSQVETVAARARGAEREALLARIAEIEVQGMTNLSGGWLKGRDLVATEGRPQQNTIRRILLLTDGLANEGITDPGTLRDLVAGAAASGVSTTTIGLSSGRYASSDTSACRGAPSLRSGGNRALRFGADYDERLLRALADAGGASTYYIEAPDQAPAVFEAELSCGRFAVLGDLRLPVRALATL